MRPPVFRKYILRLIFTLAAFSLFLSFESANGLTKTLKRTEDFVLFTGEQVPSLVGSETKDLHLYAYGRSGFIGVPFQVDKRDIDGRLVFPDEKVRDPLRDGTALDENDDMVFMIKDAGGRCTRDCWVEGAVKAEEIEITDPLEGGRAWVYLFARPGADPPETEDYVSYHADEEREYVSSSQYEIGTKFTESYYDFLRLRRPDGSWGQDIYDRQKMGIKGRLLDGAIPISIPESMMKSKLFGVIDGPVRVIRYEFNYLKLLEQQFGNEFFVNYYFNGHFNPVQISVPFSFRKVFLEISILWAIDYNDEIMGSMVHNTANPGGMILDGKPDKNIDDESEIKYVIVSGKQGALIDIWIKGERLAKMLTTSTYIREDLSKKDPSEDHPGQLTAGFMTRSVERVIKGTYRYWLYHYFPYPFTDEKVKGIFKMIEHPVELTVKPVEPPPNL